MMSSGGSRALWGRRYLMVRPDHFRVDYQINPFMDISSPPDVSVAMRQWQDLRATLESYGGIVEVADQRPDAPDMVYAMNLGLAVTDGSDQRIVLSHMRFAERRMETVSAKGWFEDAGFRPSSLGSEGVGPTFEAGDAFPFAGTLVVGYGPRTEELALKHLTHELGVRARGVRLTHPAMYHLDLAFCPLDERRALVCPAAFDEASARALLALVPEPILITEDEALTTFCANSVVLDRTVVMPGCPDRLRSRLESAGFSVAIVDVSEFHKGGGSVRCLTNPLDIAMGRDLDDVPGGEVTIS